MYLITPAERLKETGLYFEDDWRVTKTLTVNLGMRRDYFAPMTEKYNRLSNVDFTTGQIVVAGQTTSDSAGVLPDHRDFSPRFGFAQMFGANTVLRGGYGMTYTDLTSNIEY